MRKGVLYVLSFLYLCLFFSCASYKKFDYAAIDSVKSLEGIYQNEEYAISGGFNASDYDRELWFKENDIFKIEFPDPKTLNLSYLSNTGWKFRKSYKGKYNRKKNTFDIWHSRKIWPFIIAWGHDFEKVRIGKDEDGKLVINNAKNNMGFIIPLGAAGDNYSYIKKVSSIEELPPIPYTRNNKWGYTDMDGDVMIEVRFDSVTVFEGSVARVSLNGKWGYVNKEDSIVLDLRYDSVAECKNDMAKVKLNNKWSWVRINDPKIIKKPGYDDVEIISDDILYFKQDEKWGVSDGKGKIITPARYRRIERKEAYSCFYVYSEEGKVGLLSADGVETLPPIYDKINFDDFKKKYAVTYLGNKMGIITNEKIIYPPVFKFISFDLSDLYLNKEDDFVPLARIVHKNHDYALDDEGYLYKLKLSLWKGLKYVINFDSKIHYTELLKDSLNNE